MLNFSIMSFEHEEHLEEICEDIKAQVELGIATMPLFCSTLTPEGNPAIDKAGMCASKYLKFKKRLDEMGVPSGILIQASIGHGYKLNQSSAFEKYVNLDDGKSPEVCCPLGMGFQAYIREAGATLARTNPNHIMLDDDFRLIFRKGHGCACPLHLKKFAELSGKSVTREELWETMNQNTDEGRQYREWFIQTQFDSLIACVKEIRRGIDSVNPKIPGSYSLCGKGAEAGYEIASIMAGEENPVVVRLNHANYCAIDPRSVVGCFYKARVELSALTKMPDVVLAESDTCPQNRYSTSAAKLHTFFTFSFLEGLAGAKHWITRLHAYEPTSGKAYRQKLAKYKNFYEEIERVYPKLRFLGCNVLVPDHPIYEITEEDKALASDNTWLSPLLERYGLPVFFDDCASGVSCFSGRNDRWYSDEKIIEFLSGKVLLDAPAAMSLIQRGFGKYIGVDVKPREVGAKNASGEILYPEGRSGAQFNIHEIIPLSTQTKRHSDVFHLVDGKIREILFPGVTSYQNELGGTVVVYGGNSNFPYNLGAAFGFLNESRKAHFASILKELGELPLYYPEDAEVFLKVARNENGRLFCAILNLGLDPIEDFPLNCEADVKEVSLLKADGTYENVPFVQNAERVELSLTANPYEPVILWLDV